MKTNFSVCHFLIKKSGFKYLLRIMKTCLSFLFVFSFQMIASDTNAQGAIVELSTNSFTVEKLINEVAKQTDYIESSMQQQTKTITGTINDSEGVPIIGATIVEKGNPSHGTVTDIDGNFTLTNVPNNGILVISYVGMSTQEINVLDRLSFTMTLQDDTVGLDEVVVVGYGSQTKATVTGAISGVDSKNLIQSPVANLSNSLAGRVAGLMSTQISGAPGYDQSSLRIRGVGTFTGLTSPLIMVDGIEAQSFDNLDPNEIENISILKDASATAVYGVRGANGVILVTTKRGGVGKPKVSFSAQTAISSVTDKREYLRSPEWARGHNEAAAYDSYTSGIYRPRFSEEDIQKYRDQTDPLFYPDVDWVDMLLKPTSSQSQYNFNISGGSKLAKYFISLGYFNQGGLFNNDVYDVGYDTSLGYKRYNFRSNFDFDVTDRLKIKVNLSSQIEKFKGDPSPTVATQQKFGTYMMFMYSAPPNSSPGIWDDKIVNLPIQAGSLYLNPLSWFFGHPFQRSDENFINGLVRADYELDFIFKGLSIHGTASYQYRNRVNQAIATTLVTYRAFPIEGGKGYALGPEKDASPFSFGESTNFYRREDFEAGLDYDRTFGNHSFTGLLLYNQSSEYPGPSLSIPRVLQGLVGRVTYDYKKRYMAEYNFGYNGTENFARGRRFGYFPAYSLGWVLSEESIFPKNKILTYMKLRGSYGEVGNDRIGGTRFLYNPSSYVYGEGSNYAFGIAGQNISQYTGVGEGVLGNPMVTWERAKKLDIGIDFVIANSLRGSIDYFSENRNNILANPQTVPNIAGADFPAYNFGEMENHGVDGELNYNGRINNFNYWSKFVFAFTENKIIFRDEPPQPMLYRSETGQRDGQYFGLLEDGYYNSWDEVIDAYRPISSYSTNRIQPGDFKYKDINGDGIIDNDDQIPLGYAIFPNSSFGLSLGGEYKGLDFSILLESASRVTRRNPKVFVRGWQDENSSTLSFIYDEAWTLERYLADEKIDMPRIGIAHSNQHNYQLNSKWLQDGSYLRIKNVEIGYSLPKNVLRRLGASSVRVFINTNNLLTFSGLKKGIDPGSPTWGDSENDPYPVMKTVNGGINVNF